MDHDGFPWRLLGTLLVERELLTAAQLELALGEQRRNNRRLGQILVMRGYVSALTLARALAEQHGVELQGDREEEPDPLPELVDRPWQPLGRLLVMKGRLTRSELDDALAEQAREPGRRLGEVLVGSGRLSGLALASALAEQHGVALPVRAAFAGRLQTVITPAPLAGPRYCVDAGLAPASSPRPALYESANFLEAVDFAFEYLEEKQPPLLEIQKVDGDARETVWTYSEKRAAAEAASRKSLVTRFGFDPTRWDPRAQFEPGEK